MGKSLGTIAGGVAGFVIGGPAGAAVGAGLGAGLDDAGRKEADAMQGIADAQANEQRGARDTALRFAEATPRELEQLTRAVQLNEADIERKERLLASSDPAIMEAGTQALQLLRGEEAKVIGPMRDQFAKDEQKLRAQLQQQLGPGYETSTAGIQALRAFEQKKNMAFANAQQQTLGQLLGVAQDSSARFGTQQNLQNASGIANQFGNIQERKIGALLGTPQTAAGSQFVGQLASARNQQQTIGSVLQLGAMAYGGAFGGSGMGASTPVAPTGGSLAGNYTLNSGAGITVPTYNL